MSDLDVDDLAAENARLRDELARARDRLTAIRAIVAPRSSGG